mgnify:CR=1 FL=1
MQRDQLRRAPGTPEITVPPPLGRGTVPERAGRRLVEAAPELDRLVAEGAKRKRDISAVRALEKMPFAAARTIYTQVSDPVAGAVKVVVAAVGVASVTVGVPPVWVHSYAVMVLLA